MLDAQSTERSTIGDVIRAWRMVRRMRANTLAKLAKVSPAYISELENNRIDQPSSERLERIAAALDVPVQTLVDRRFPTDQVEAQPVSLSEPSHKSEVMQETPNEGSLLPQSASAWVDWLLALPGLTAEDRQELNSILIRNIKELAHIVLDQKCDFQAATRAPNNAIVDTSPPSYPLLISEVLTEKSNLLPDIYNRSSSYQPPLRESNDIEGEFQIEDELQAANRLLGSISRGIFSMSKLEDKLLGS